MVKSYSTIASRLAMVELFAAERVDPSSTFPS
jgi:hypothetical protein